VSISKNGQRHSHSARSPKVVIRRKVALRRLGELVRRLFQRCSKLALLLVVPLVLEASLGGTVHESVRVHLHVVGNVKSTIPRPGLGVRVRELPAFAKSLDKRNNYISGTFSFFVSLSLVRLARLSHPPPPPLDFPSGSGRIRSDCGAFFPPALRLVAHTPGRLPSGTGKRFAHPLSPISHYQRTILVFTLSIYSPAQCQILRMSLFRSTQHRLKIGATRHHSNRIEREPTGS